MTTLVTGAAGFLGSRIVELLVASGDRPHVLIAPGDPHDHLSQHDVVRCVGDIRDRDALRAALSGVTRVVHCAAKTGPWGDAATYEQINVHALAGLVTAAMQAGVQRVVHVSSITVHGNDVGGCADETSPLRGEPNPYSRSKVAGERLLERLIAERRAPVTIVRPGWIYGAGDRASFARLAQTVGAGRMVVLGRGDNRLPLIHVDDAARGALLAGRAAGAAGRRYVLVNDEPVTQLQFLSAIAAELEVPIPRRHLPYRLMLGAGSISESLGRIARLRQPPPVMRYGLQMLGGDNRFSIDRARNELGFTPQVSMADGVRSGIGWYLDRSRPPEPAMVTAAA